MTTVPVVGLICHRWRLVAEAGVELGAAAAGDHDVPLGGVVRVEEVEHVARFDLDPGDPTVVSGVTG
jgi:hypothetical protein